MTARRRPCSPAELYGYWSRRSEDERRKLVVLALVVMIVALALVVPVVAGAVARVGDGSTAAQCQSGHACGGAPVAAMCQSGYSCGGRQVAAGRCRVRTPCVRVGLRAAGDSVN